MNPLNKSFVEQFGNLPYLTHAEAYQRAGVALRQHGLKSDITMKNRLINQLQHMGIIKPIVTGPRSAKGFKLC